MTTKPATNIYLDEDIKAAVIQWAKRNRLSMSAAINIMCTSDKHVPACPRGSEEDTPPAP